MIQHLLIGIIFFSALAYLVMVVRKQFASNSTCGSGCSGCKTVDFEKIAQAMQSHTAPPKN